jgi:hypothetical protein
VCVCVRDCVCGHDVLYVCVCVWCAGVWLQYKEENFDEFLRFSGTSFALRKVIPVAFFMTRHTLSVTSKTVTAQGTGAGAEGQEREEEYFSVKRDFGEGVREWTLTMKMGRDEQSAEAVQAVIDTEESYVFQNWANEAEQSICTLSTPSNPEAGVKCLQTRSLCGPDEIRMVRTLPNYINCFQVDAM